MEGALVRLRLVLAYQGTRFHGWQLQAGDRTVQGVLEQALAVLAGVPVRAVGSGRTDAGVHAWANRACRRAPEPAGLPWRRALNALLPGRRGRGLGFPGPGGLSRPFRRGVQDLRLHPVDRAEFVWPQRRPFVWACAPVDRAVMEEAALEFTGTRDFAACRTRHGNRHHGCARSFSIAPSPGASPFETVWRFTADGFLKQMVRKHGGLPRGRGQG
jgi:tRNA pseudouridine38-40 synthase